MGRVPRTSQAENHDGGEGCQPGSIGRWATLWRVGSCRLLLRFDAGPWRAHECWPAGLGGGQFGSWRLRGDC